jgi:hypothetical protein
LIEPVAPFRHLSFIIIFGHADEPHLLVYRGTPMKKSARAIALSLLLVASPAFAAPAPAAHEALSLEKAVRLVMEWLGPETRRQKPVKPAKPTVMTKCGGTVDPNGCPPPKP